MMDLNDEGLTNLDDSIIFNVRRLAMLLDPLKPGWVAAIGRTFVRKECISYLIIYLFCI